MEVAVGCGSMKGDNREGLLGYSTSELLSFAVGVAKLSL